MRRGLRGESTPLEPLSAWVLGLLKVTLPKFSKEDFDVEGRLLLSKFLDDLCGFLEHHQMQVI